MPDRQREAPCACDPRVLAALDRLLGEESDAYQQLLAFQQALHDRLVTRAFGDVLPHLPALEGGVRHIQALGQQRQALLATLAAQLGTPPETLTLRRLAALCPSPYDTRFRAHRRALRQHLRALQQLGRTNAALLRQALALVGGALALVGSLVPTLTYQESGTRPAPLQGRLLSQRA
ncbi:MAG: hypothetical protein KatS3mg131_1293 [Candidatus Tectimicrobiota bacterium]|nr:MAG: hypothetical protein KatS3mg131_1293 [Candidatus Tectomicrobia bacterium]